MDFEGLVGAVAFIHEQLVAQATRAVNISLTVRNWLIGYYIREYELNGTDRANYGERLFGVLADRLTRASVSNCNRRQLYRYRDFYCSYPGIVGTLSPQLANLLPNTGRAVGKMGTAHPQSVFTPDDAINRLSYSHFEELAEIEDSLKRAFYETECIRGNWSVRELKRQIASLYYERSGLSRDKRKLAEIVESKAGQMTSAQVIRDPYGVARL